MKIVLLLAFSFIITGCGTLPSSFCKPEPLRPVIQKVVQIDPRVIEPCRVIQTPVVESFSDVLISTRDIMAANIECKNKMDAAIIVIKKFSNN